MKEDVCADLNRACGEAIEGLGRLRDEIHKAGEEKDGVYRCDLMAMLEVAYRILQDIEGTIKLLRMED